MTFQIQPTLVEKIKKAQKEDHILQKFRTQVEDGLRIDVRIHSDGALYFVTKFVYHKGKFDRKF